jgi:arylformamidase
LKQVCRFPVLDQQAADYLVEYNLKGIGADTISFDPLNDHELRVHKIFLSHGIVLIENLTNLENLPNSPFIFSCLPLRIKDGDGSPVRAVGIVTGD